MTARAVAIRVLTRVEREEAFASRAIDDELESAHLPPRDRALATEIAYGVLRHRARLDRAMASKAARGLGRLDPETLAVLRAGAYQILLLDRVPGFAAVDESVGWIRRRRGDRLAGFANALLRRLATEGEPPPASWEADPVAHIAGSASLPAWLARRMLAQLGPRGAREFADALLQRAPVVLRANRLRDIGPARLARMLRADHPGVDVRPGLLAPDALVASGFAAPHRDPRYRAGSYAVQDEAAQMAALLVAPRPGWRVLDACAGVGTKSTHLAALMRDRGRVDAIDTSGAKVAAAREAARRMRATIVRPALADLLEWPQHDYDAVLLDAPCSGLGVLRRHPEAKWRVVEGDVARLAAAQARLLDAAAARVRPGGILVCAVCTFTEEETSAVVRAFLASDAGFAVDAPPRAPWWDGLREPDGSFRTWTHRHGTDAFTMSRFVRREPA